MLLDLETSALGDTLEQCGHVTVVELDRRLAHAAN
jgi:hypothetical protein